MLTRDENEFKFISNYIDLTISKEEYPNSWRQSFYKKIGILYHDTTFWCDAY